MSPATRRRLYREGKRLLGPDRMARLRDRSVALARRARGLRTRAIGLRERLLPSPAVRVERVLPVDGRAFVIAGTLGPAAARAPGPIDARATPADGPAAALALHPFAERRHRDAGGLRAGFAALLAPEADAADGKGTAPPPATLTVRLPDGTERTVPCPAPEPIAGPLARVVALLGPLGACAAGRRALLDAVLGPAIGRAWEARPARTGARADAPAPALVRHNPTLAPAAPRTTIVVPIYGRHDFIAHQLVHFVQDPEVRASELLYVIDDPRLDAAVRRDAERLARLHDIAFTVLHLPENLGYAGANNAAAAVAAGRELLLLNSDVLPAAPGWLGRLRAAADGAPGARGHAGGPAPGRIVGARLLYDDGSVQHDGMRFEPGPNVEGLWLNRHPGKGLPADLFDAGGEFLPREAVTGACLLIDRARYLELGGLDEAYVLGDFEDSDLCLKARAAGVEIGLAPGATLYHLERQSQSLVTGARWKTDLTLYNCWVHTGRWHASILALKGAGA